VERDAFASLVPELMCRDPAASRAFYVDLVGFSIRYERPESDFVFLDLEGAQIMLCPIPRLPQGAGRQRAHPHPPARRGLRDLARLRRRRRVIVNTCGFLDSAKAESLEAIGEALPRTAASSSPAASARRRSAIRAAHPSVLAVTGPQQYEQVLDAVHEAVPPAPDPFIDLIRPRA
jgi:catechol 2,3-dioxygenase-like lactoylglutathione lyase family enzyme